MKDKIKTIVFTLVACLIIGLIIFVVYRTSGGVDTSRRIVKVNGHSITENMFKKEFETSINSMFRGADFDAKNPQNRYMYLLHKGNAINTLILKTIIKEEAHKRKITVTKEEIEKTINEIVNRMGGKEKLDEILAMSKLDYNTFKNNLELDLLKKKIVENILGNKQVSDDDIKKFYNENKEKFFKHGVQVRASHILISATEDDLKQKVLNELSIKTIPPAELNKKIQEKMNISLKKAQDIQKELKQHPEKFAEMAKKSSDDTATASKGGDLGFFKEGEMVPEFTKAAYALKPGQISDVIKTQFGFHIIKAEDRKEAGTQPFDEVAEQIKMYLTSQKQMETFKTLIETARQSANIVFLDDSYNPVNIQTEIMKLQEMGQKGTPKADAPKAETPKEPVKK